MLRRKILCFKVLADGTSLEVFAQISTSMAETIWTPRYGTGQIDNKPLFGF